MSIKDDLDKEVAKIFRSTWSERDGDKVPEAEDVKLDNDAVKLKGTVLYADLSDSTGLVDGYKAHFAAEVYKAFLHCAAKIIRTEGGVITAYDGDRIMAVYIGGSQNTSAVRTALTIRYAVGEIINPKLKAQYATTSYVVNYAVGIDTSDLYVARTGVRGANDLVWVGRAANHAAKLSACSLGHTTYITTDVYSAMHEETRTSNGRSMWTSLAWSDLDGRTIYGSSWQWRID